VYFIFPLLVALVQPPDLSCDPALTALFTPARPQLGRYEVCTTGAPLPEVAQPGWTIGRVVPLDAFGTAGRYDRHAVSRLYGGKGVLMARGWIQRNGVVESITLISPYPDVTLARLVQGTLMIRFIICCP
jgi:hypothetical protein